MEVDTLSGSCSYVFHGDDTIIRSFYGASFYCFSSCIDH